MVDNASPQSGRPPITGWSGVDGDCTESEITNSGAYHRRRRGVGCSAAHLHFDAGDRGVVLPFYARCGVVAIALMRIHLSLCCIGRRYFLFLVDESSFGQPALDSAISLDRVRAEIDRFSSKFLAAGERDPLY